MKIAVFLIFTHLLSFIYGSTGLPPVPADDYLDKLKAAIGTKDPKDLAYLDLRKLPIDDTQLLPFKKGYIFLNGTSVVECTSESLLFEYLLGTKGPVERSSYKITDVAKAITEQRISVRGIKLLMAHWLDNETHRFVRSTGCSCKIRGHREDVKASNVFGLYEREAFLQSCRPRVGAVDILTLLLAESLVDVLLKKAPETAAAGAATVPTTFPASNKEVEKEARERAKRAKQRKEYRKRLRLRKVAARETAAVATTDDDQDSEDNVEAPTVDLAGAVAVSDGEDDVPVVVSSSQQDALAILEAAFLPTQGNLSLFSDGLLPRFGQDALTDTSPPAFTASPRRFRTTPSTPSRLSLTPPRSPAKTPPSSPSEPWSIAWAGGVEAEYDDVLDQRDHLSLKRKFEDLKALITTKGMVGLRGLIRKIESMDDVFSYRLNDFYRAVFSMDSKTKTITFIKGIEHYKGIF